MSGSSFVVFLRRGQRTVTSLVTPGEVRPGPLATLKRPLSEPRLVPIEDIVKSARLFVNALGANAKGRGTELSAITGSGGHALNQAVNVLEGLSVIERALGSLEPEQVQILKPALEVLTNPGFLSTETKAKIEALLARF